MDIPDSYIEKIRPQPRKSGDPRNERDELVQRFLDRMNIDQRRDNRKEYTQGYLRKKFEGLSDSRLHQLFKECSDPSVRSFGAMLTYKLKHV